MLAHIGTHSPRPHRGQDGAEAARRVAQAGRATIRRQNLSSRGRGTEVSASGAASLHSGHLRGIGPEPGTWNPATEQRGIRELRIGLPARQWRLRDACGLSRLNDLPAPWSQARMPSCNRQGHIDLDPHGQTRLG